MDTEHHADSTDRSASLTTPPPRSALDRAVAHAAWHLIPFLLLMYVLSYIDRANIGYAKQAFQASTGLSNAAFAFGAGIFFIGYAAFELPSNLMLHRLGARVWLSRIMISWGLISAAMIFVHSAVSFYIVRILLGSAEAGFFPGVILFLTFWFPASARPRILAIFYFGAPIALTLGGPLSGLLLNTDGLLGMPGWKTMFAVEGLLAASVGAACLFCLTDRPRDAAWLAQDEREALVRAMDEDGGAKSGAHAASFAAVLRDPRLVHFAAVYILIQISGYGVIFYLPTQVGALLGMKVGTLVGLVTAIPWMTAIVVCSFWPALAAAAGRRRSFTIISLMTITTGLVVAANTPPLVAIGAMCCVAAGLITAQAIFWTFPTNYLGGRAAAGSFAVINAIGNLGGFVAPNLKNFAEEFWGSTAAGLYVLAASAALAGILMLFLTDRPHSRPIVRTVPARD